MTDTSRAPHRQDTADTRRTPPDADTPDTGRPLSADEREQSAAVIAAAFDAPEYLLRKDTP